MTGAVRQAYSDLEKNKEDFMLWTVAIVLFVLWALGFLAFGVSSSLIHLLIVAAVIVLAYQLITGRRGIA